MTLPQPNGSYLNDVYLGAGRVDLLADLLDRHAIEHPLVVTDATLVDHGFLDRLPLDEPATFQDVQTNPDAAMVKDGLATYRDADCDGLVSLGGGSPIDVAKGIAMLVNNPGPLGQYAHVRQNGAQLTAPLPPHVAVPTTAGSGSEVGRAALLVTESGEKLGFIDFELLPEAAICDPELTASLPPRLAAATGMDALSHCIETFCSPRVNPTADALALDGFKRGYHAIGAATTAEPPLSARREMMVAALHGGLAFQKGLGAVHSLSHPLGALADKNLHHGTLNAIFLPHVIRFNADACPDKLARLADRAGLADAEAFPAAIDELLVEVGLPRSLGELRVKRDDIDRVVDAAVADHSSATNPRSLTAADVLSLYEEAL